MATDANGFMNNTSMCERERLKRDNSLCLLAVYMLCQCVNCSAGNEQFSLQFCV